MLVNEADVRAITEDWFKRRADGRRWRDEFHIMIGDDGCAAEHGRAGRCDVVMSDGMSSRSSCGHCCDAVPCSAAS